AYQDDNGAPLAFGKLNVYDSGTSTRHNIYPDATLTPGQELANPLTADAAGRFAAAYVADGINLKIVITDQLASQTIYQRDPVKSPDAVSTATTTRPYSTKNTDYTLVAADNGKAIGFDSSAADRTITANSSTLGNGFWINISKI